MSVVRGPLARLERVRQPLREPEHLRARAEAEAEAGDDRGAVQPAAARGRRDEVAVAVGDVEVAGVARQAERRLAGAGGARDGGGERRHPRLAPVGRARAQRLRRALAHERAALVRVGRAQQRVERDVHELRVAVPRLAVRERELRALDDGVDVVRPGAHRREVEARQQRELLEHHRPLPPRPGLADRVAVVVERHRRLERRLPAREVVAGQQPAVAAPARVHAPRPRASSRRSPRPPSRGRTRRARRRSGPRACSPRGCSRARSARTCRPARGLRNRSPAGGTGR